VGDGVSKRYQIALPAPLKEILQGDPELHASVLDALNTFGQWLDASNMPFFPEYTQHGSAHVTSVIETAWLLLNDHAEATLKPVDAVILSLAALLHDAAMHLSEAGFLALFEEDELATPLPGFKEQDWRTLWQDFSAEAARWDERQLLDIFGEPEPLLSITLDPLQMTKKDRLAIGVFLRRHHHRLAHEIAIRGVPGPNGQRMKVPNMPADILDLAGIVARSHGQPLRASSDHVREGLLGGIAAPRIVLLMASLRIADFLDAKPDRAPSQVTLTRRLCSPISQQEHKVNQCISSISFEEDDPYAIAVRAQPPDVQTYVRMRKWLDALKSEIDSAGAILGEIYAGQTPIASLRFLRVTSNLDDPEAFSQTVDYVPEEIRLTVAENDLIRLLIEPLYGDSPEIGIRELVQNSVDAVRELRSLEKTGGVGKPSQATDGSFDVIVSLVRDKGYRTWVSVDDCGIGMSLQTIVNYFLRVGAAFRRSSEWRLQFEPVAGSPTVLRSGRFGIGVLAAFLLGPKVRVSTRHATAQEDEGLEFEVGLESQMIEIRRVSRPVGTSIGVQIKYNTWKHLSENPDSWDWYHQASPSVRRQIIQDGEVEQLKTRFLLPRFGEPLPLHWHQVKTEDFPEIHWTFANGPAAMNCNGIEIGLPSSTSYLDRLTVHLPDRLRVGGMHQGNPLFSNLHLPKLSVSDPRGKLPVNLQRTGFTTYTVPFEKALLDDVMRNIVACLVACAPLAPPGENERLSRYRVLIPYDYPAGPGFHSHNYLSYEDARWDPWFFMSNGAGPTTYWNITHAGIKSALLICLETGSLFGDSPLLAKLSSLADAVFIFGVDEKKTFITRWVRFALLDKGYGKNPFERLKVRSTRILIPERVANEVCASQRFPKRLKTKLNEVRINEQYLLWDAGNADYCQVNLGEVAKDLAPQFASSVIAIAEWSLESIQPRFTLTPFEKEWSVSVDNAIVPFDASERKGLIDAVRSQLGSHMDSHEELAKQWRRKQLKKNNLPRG
jgi:hypothetical protein